MRIIKDRSIFDVMVPRYCPECGTGIHFYIEAIQSDQDEDYPCPQCHELLLLRDYDEEPLMSRLGALDHIDNELGGDSRQEM